MNKKFFVVLFMALGVQSAMLADHTSYTTAGYDNCNVAPRRVYRGRRWNSACCPTVGRCRPKRACAPRRRVCRPRQKCCYTTGRSYGRGYQKGHRTAVAEVVAAPVEESEALVEEAVETVTSE